MVFDNDEDPDVNKTDSGSRTLSRVRNMVKGTFGTWVLLATLLTGPAAAQPSAGLDLELVAVAGASGRTGLRIAEELAASGYAVRALTSNRPRAIERHGTRFDWREADVREPQSLPTALEGARNLVIVIGASEWEGPNSPQFVDYQGVRNLVDVARELGLKHVVLISSAAAGPYRERSRSPTMGNVRHWKTEGENHLKRSGLAYTIIGPGGLEDRASRGEGLRVLTRRDYAGGSIARGDVARVAVAALSEPAARNKSFALVRDESLSGDSWRKQLAAIPPDAQSDEAAPPGLLPPPP
jgi:uncharacterized protein YbjT (DUF2867 family)